MKMEKPTAEAVRFTSADVIATSGGGGVNPYANLTAGRVYTTLASEAIEGGFIVTDNRNFYSFRYMGKYKGNDIIINKETSDSLNTNYIYTWFDNDQWWTDNDQTVMSLIIIGSHGDDPSSTNDWRTAGTP